MTHFDDDTSKKYIYFVCMWSLASQGEWPPREEMGEVCVQVCEVCNVVLEGSRCRMFKECLLLVEDKYQCDFWKVQTRKK